MQIPSCNPETTLVVPAYTHTHNVIRACELAGTAHRNYDEKWSV